MIDFKKYFAILLGVAFFSVSLLYYFTHQFHVVYNQAMQVKKQKNKNKNSITFERDL